MSEVKHTQEPWKTRTPTEIVDGRSDIDCERHIASCRSFHDANRIVECVNACTGLTSEQVQRLPEMINEGTIAIDQCKNLRIQRDELFGCLQDILHRFQSCIHGGNGELDDDKPAIERAKAAIEISFKSKALGV